MNNPKKIAVQDSVEDSILSDDLFGEKLAEYSVIDLQPPPYTRLNNRFDYTNTPVTLMMTSNRIIDGTFESYDAQQEVIYILTSSDFEFVEIKIADLIYMELKVPYEFKVVKEDSSSPLQKLDTKTNSKKFVLNFQGDKEPCEGFTLGSRVDKNGVHLYKFPQDDENANHCFHFFVTKLALKDYVIGDKIGEVLIKEQEISKSDLDDALKDQNENRSNKIGDYLVAQKIVDVDMLEEALERQKHMPNLKLGEILISEGIISESQLDVALREQKKKIKTPLGELLISRGALKKDQLQKCLSKKLGIPFVNLKEFVLDPDIFKTLPATIAYKHSVIPLNSSDGNLVVAMENPLDWQALDVLRFTTNKNIDPVMASHEDIAWALQFYYSTDDISDSFDNIFENVKEEEETYDKNIFSNFERSEISENIVVKVINKIITDAHAQKVSDIHIEPGKKGEQVVVRFRKDGALFVYYKFPTKYQSVFVSRLKVMAHLDISVRFKPQDGKINFNNYSSLNLELRVATIPTNGGIEDVVVRLLGSGKILPINGIGLDAGKLNTLMDLTSRPHGLFLVCGPTGSGKTTTLHSILGSLNTQEKKIWTAEDPVEITQPGIRQVLVNEKLGMSFAKVMRALLRADPDIIMIGEMRDSETASTAIEASLTGHLVFSTLHTNSAAETIVRLLDMGMDEFNFSDALLGILSQRLVKSMCVSCKIAYQPDINELNMLATEYCREASEGDLIPVDILSNKIDEWREVYFQGKDITLYKPVGCQECAESGYRGRVGVYELLTGTPNIKKMILKKAPAADIKVEAQKAGMITRKQDGIVKILLGLIDFPQIRIL